MYSGVHGKTSSSPAFSCSWRSRFRAPRALSLQASALALHERPGRALEGAPLHGVVQPLQEVAPRVLFGRVKPKKHPPPAPRPKPRPAMPSDTSTSADSSDNTLVLLQVKRGLLPAMSLNYQAVTATDPEARGKLAMSWRVEPNGMVSAVRIGEDTLTSHELRNRVIYTVTHWRFQPVREPVDVSFPFVFG